MEFSGDAVAETNGAGKTFNRRYKIWKTWIAVSVGLVFAQKFFLLDLPLVLEVVKSSAYLAVVVALGLSGTDAAKSWADAKKCAPNGTGNTGG